MKPECSQRVKHKLIVFEEKRSKLTIINKKGLQVIRVKVDNCEITEGIRCDYLLIAKKVEHFIELKGQDIDHAIKQIKSSIRELSTDLRNTPKVSFVICTRSPMASAKIQSIQIFFFKEFKSKLIIKNSPFEYSLLV